MISLTSIKQFIPQVCKSLTRPPIVKSLASMSLLCATALIAGCDDDNEHNDGNNGSTTRSYTVTLSNLTANQPLSPAAIILHQAGYHAFVDGETASNALEILAEGGDNSALLTEAQAHSAYLTEASGSQPIGPGASDTFQLTLDNNDATYLSLVTMLVNTNDAFTGSNAYKISTLHVDDSVTLNLPAWDAGTEANTEAAGTIPGPADGGEGYNGVRDDFVDFVGFHRGVVSADDGLATSVLNESHRFDNPVARLHIMRTE